MDPTLLGLILIVSGALCVAAAIFDWDFFMQGRGARGIVAIFGRSATRVFYAIFGAAMGGLGVALALGLIGAARAGE